ncbi:MAG: flippase [Candidatus Levyibacteriota bacterium]
MERKIFLNTFYQIFGKVVISFLGLVGTSFLTRYLGPIGFSEYSFIFAFVGFAYIFMDFGLGTLLTRTLASQKEGERLFSEFFSLRVLLSVIVLFFSMLIVIFLPYTTEIKIGIFIASFSTIFILFSGVFWGLFQAEIKFSKMVIPQIITSVCSFLLISLGVIFRANLFYFLLISVAASLVGLFISFLFSKYKKLFIFNFKVFWRIIIKALPFGIGLITSVAYFKVDILILSFFYNPSFYPDVGLYSLSYKVFEVAVIFGGLFSQTLFPLFSRIINSKVFLIHFKKYLLYSLLISFSAILVLLFFANFFISILGGSKFLQSAQSLRILSLAAGSSILAGFFSSVAIAGHKEVLILKFSIIALILNVFLNFVFIPQFSFIAASWTTVVTQSFIMTTNIFASYLVIKQHLRMIKAP